jgi:uncharacterized membrane protein YccC
MRRRNWRVVITGLFFAFAAVGFFFFMLTIAPQSTDPAELMRTVGGASGTAIGVSLAMIIFGLIGKKA